MSKNYGISFSGFFDKRLIYILSISIIAYVKVNDI